MPASAVEATTCTSGGLATTRPLSPREYLDVGSWSPAYEPQGGPAATPIGVGVGVDVSVAVPVAGVTTTGGIVGDLCGVALGRFPAPELPPPPGPPSWVLVGLIVGVGPSLVGVGLIVGVASLVTVGVRVAVSVGGTSVKVGADVLLAVGGVVAVTDSVADGV